MGANGSVLGFANSYTFHSVYYWRKFVTFIVKECWPTQRRHNTVLDDLRQDHSGGIMVLRITAAAPLLGYGGRSGSLGPLSFHGPASNICCELKFILK